MHVEAPLCAVLCEAWGRYADRLESGEPHADRCRRCDGTGAVVEHYQSRSVVDGKPTWKSRAHRCSCSEGDKLPKAIPVYPVLDPVLRESAYSRDRAFWVARHGEAWVAEWEGYGVDLAARARVYAEEPTKREPGPVPEPVGAEEPPF